MGLTLVQGCSRPPDEAALRTAIGEMEVALESRDASALLERVDVEFVGPGGMDREALRRYVAGMVFRRSDVDVVLGPVTIELHGDRARAAFDAVVRGGPWLSGDVQARRVETAWRRDDGEWRLLSADWSKPALSN